MLGEALSLSCALTWSVSILLFRRSEAVSPQAINLFKNVISALLMAATLVVAGGGIDWSRTDEDWARLIVSGIVGIAVADTVFFTALRLLGPSRLAVVETAYSPLVVLFSVLMLGEPLAPAFLLGGALVLLGVLIVNASPGRREVVTPRGVAVALGAIAMMAFAIVLAKPALERGELIEVTLIRLVAGTLAQLGWIALSPTNHPLLSVLKPSPVWRTLLPASILGGWLSMILWLGGYQLTHASTAAVLNQTTTVFTIGLAWFFLEERLSLRQAAGSALAISGVLVVLILIV